MKSIKKKILFRIGSLRAGGAERVLLNVTNYLKNEFDVTILLNVNAGELLTEIAIGVKLKYINEKPKNTWGKIVNTFRYQYYSCFPKQMYFSVLKDNNYDFEVSFSHGMPQGVLRSPNKKSKKIIWMHADVFKTKQATPSYLKLIARHDFIVAVSDYLVSDLQSSLPNHRSIKKATNLLDIKRIQSLSEEPIKEADAMRQEISLISIGTLSKVKGHAELIRVHKQLMDEKVSHHLYIIGEGPERVNLEQLIGALAVSDTVSLMGHKENPYPYLKNSSIFVHNSASEGYGNVLLEALILNKPIVSSPIKSADEILNKGKWGRITNSRSEDLHKNLKELILGKEKRRDLERLLVLNQPVYDPETIKKEIDDIFK